MTDIRKQIIRDRTEHLLEIEYSDILMAQNIEYIQSKKKLGTASSYDLNYLVCLRFLRRLKAKN